MAIRFDAAGDYLYLATSVPDDGIFTVALRVYISVDRNASGVIATVMSSGGVGVAIGLAANGTTLRALSSGSETTGTDLSVSTWYHVTLVKNGSSILVYLNGVQDISRTDALTWTTAYILLNDPTVWCNMRSANMRVWEAALTQAEIQADMRSYLPARTANLLAWWPMLPGATERLKDYSGNGRNLTAAGTLADEDGPPLSWGGYSIVMPWVASGGDVTVSLNAATLAAAGQALTVTPGAATVALSVGALAATGQALTVTAPPPAVTVTLNAANLSAAGQAVSVVPGARTVALASASITASGQAVTVIPGAVAVVLGAGALTAAGQTLTVTPGAIAVALAAGTLAVGGQALTVNAPAPGAVVVALNAASLSAAGQALTVLPGAVAVLLAAATGAATGQVVSVNAPAPGALVVSLNTAALTASGQALTAVPGAVGIILNAGVILTSGQVLAVVLVITSTTPPERTMRLERENRRVVIDAESRAVNITGETRTKEVKL